MNDIIIKSYYYIIKVTDGVRLYYKIGETTKNKKRPEALIEKYTALKRVSAEIIAFEELPNNGTKRLNDKTIHKNVSELTPADPYAIKGMLNQEEDGINEFFQTTKSDTKLVEYVKDVVSKLAQDDSNFKVKIKTLDNIILDYSGQKQTHRVKSELINKIRQFGNLKLYKEEDKNILLIGQFEPDWVATFSLENNVYILHDAKDEKHIYHYKNLNDKIVYLNELKEILF